MNKLKLVLDELEVQSFSTARGAPAKGTVYGRVTEDMTCNQFTCDYYNQTACRACEQQTYTCVSDCDAEGTQIDTCANTCNPCNPSFNEAFTCGWPSPSCNWTVCATCYYTC